jgi:hypothetical protein
VHQQKRFPVRLHNFVVSGLPESDSVSDAAAFTELCKYNLPIKPVVDDNICIRIGRAQSGEPLHLLVQLDSEETAASLLQVARFLRQSDDDFIAYNVYVNPGLSPSAAKRAYELRQQRRLRRQGRETHDVPPAASDARGDHGHYSSPAASASGVSSSAIDGKLSAPSTVARDLVKATTVLPSPSSAVAAGTDRVSSIQAAGQLSKLPGGTLTDCAVQSAVVISGVPAPAVAVLSVPLPSNGGSTLNPGAASWSSATATSTLMAGGSTVTGGDSSFLSVPLATC